LQFAKKPVIFGVRDFWRIERVIGVRVVVQLNSQDLRPSGWGHGLAVGGLARRWRLRRRWIG
jgi:hypothetical protein